jgi:hypothetical protein
MPPTTPSDPAGSRRAARRPRPGQLRSRGRRWASVASAVACLWMAASVVVAGQSGWQSLVGSGCAAASGASHAGLVVDFGTVADVAGRPATRVQSTCVSFTSGDERGTDVLQAAGYELRFNSVGLLCAIDGYPASGCGSPNGNGFQYWSYWHGGSSWTYAQTGPAFYRVSNGGVEGWRFVEGSDSAAEGVPGAAAAGPCPVSSPTTTVASAPPGSTGSVSGAPPSSAAVGPHASTTPSAAGGTTSVPSARATTTTDASAGSTITSASGSDGASARQLASAGGHHGPGPGSGSPMATIGVGSTIVGLALAAFAIARHRAVP